jgi:hypothetical protein
LINVHSYYYGPVANGEYDLQTSSQLTEVMDEDEIRNLYTMDGSPTKRIQFSKLYQTVKGPVIGVTRIEPSQSRDKRSTVTNRTIFVRLEDIVNDLTNFFDKPINFPIRTVQLKLC